MDLSEVYVDEDRALGFHVWVAELELLVGTARGRDIDQVRFNSNKYSLN
jgi:hypothetical protein